MKSVLFVYCSHKLINKIFIKKFLCKIFLAYICATLNNNTMRKDKSDLIARATTARDTLKSMGFKQNFVAEKIGISQTELSKMLNLDFYYVTEAYLDKLEAFIAKHKVDSHA